MPVLVIVGVSVIVRVGVVVRVGVRVRDGARVRVEEVMGDGGTVSVNVGVKVGDNVITDVSVGLPVLVAVSDGVESSVGEAVGVSVGGVPCCCAGLFTGAARTLLATTAPSKPPARSTMVKIRTRNLLSRNITGMIASLQ